MTAPDVDGPSPRHRWIPVVTGAALLVVFTGAVAWPRLTADAATSAAATLPQATAVATPVASTSVDACRVPQPLTVAQLASLATQPVSPPAALSAPSPARPHLRPVIRDLGDAACDTQKGRYAYTQTRQWATNVASSGGTTTLDVQLWQYQRWAAPDNSGRTITITQPTEDQARTDESYRPGELPVHVARLATDPGLLAAQLNAIQPFANGPQSALRAWDDLNAWSSPNRAQRTAALTVFRDTDGIDFNGTTHDRAGRTGIALTVTSDNGGTRDLIILDPHTGELLAYEMTALRDPGRLGITQPTVLDYHLFFAHTHTATTR
jgi:hypothetical protein